MKAIFIKVHKLTDLKPQSKYLVSIIQMHSGKQEQIRNTTNDSTESGNTNLEATMEGETRT